MQSLTAQIHPSIRDIDPVAWDRLAADAGPFLEWAMLEAFEHSGCVCAEEGWQPHHIVIEGDDSSPIAAAPMYIKGHSAGEFVFDHQWASLAHRLGVDYYPKGLVAVPFTPVTGPRMLIAPGADRPRMMRALAEVAARATADAGLSSAHWLFMSEPEALALEDAGYALRYGVQFHWHNRGYDDFDDWLSEFKSKRRRTIRRERREIAAAGVSIEVLEGDALTPDVMRLAFRLYLTTIDKKMWGRQYLNEAYFMRAREKLADRLILVLARRDGQVIAGSFFVHKNGQLYGRYWGCFEEVRFLHFELCYYQPVELAIRRGWSLFEAGAQGHHKYERGFAPVLTYSAHRLHHRTFDRIIRDALQRERAIIRDELRGMREASPSRAVAELARSETQTTEEPTP